MKNKFLQYSVLRYAIVLFALTTTGQQIFSQTKQLNLQGSTEPLQQEPDFKSIFDGESLDNWSGDEKFWSVEDGCITGKTTKENPLEKNTFLIWQGGEIDDFELRLKFRITDGNSGIQFRSTDLGDHHVGGYQADIDSKNTYTGILYEELGRGILCPRTSKISIGEKGEISTAEAATCDEKKFLDSLKTDDWNEYVVVARGNRIVQKINGFVTAEIVDNQSGKSKSAGILALQLHTGPAMTVRFKEIELKKLGKK